MQNRMAQTSSLSTKHMLASLRGRLHLQVGEVSRLGDDWREGRADGLQNNSDDEDHTKLKQVTTRDRTRGSEC